MSSRYKGKRPTYTPGPVPAWQRALVAGFVLDERLAVLLAAAGWTYRWSQRRGGEVMHRLTHGTAAMDVTTDGAEQLVRVAAKAA